MRIAMVAVIFSGCAASQGYHGYDEDNGYPIRPGNGSAELNYSNDAHRVVGTTGEPEKAVRVISEANLRDAQADVIRTRNEMMLRCFKQYGLRCYLYSSGRYSRYGYTWRGMQAHTNAREERGAVTLRAEVETAQRKSREALRGAKRAARLSLEATDALEGGE